MKKPAIIILFLFLVTILPAEMFFAETDGLKVTVLNINLKQHPSDPIGASAPDLQIDLTAGLTGESMGAINIETTNVLANELSFDFSNIEVPLKAYVTTDGTDYYYTTAAGVAGPVTSDKGTWTGYDYMNVPKISPSSSENRVVIQSYFPEPLFIEDGVALVVTGSVDLEYTVLFWDGDNSAAPAGSPFTNTTVYPADEMAFAVTDPDIVLGVNTSLTKETYAFGANTGDLDPNLDTTLCKVVSFFFDDSGNLYDGAVKKSTGYGSGLNWQRVKAVNRNGNGSYNLEFARSYDTAQGEYYFDVTSDNTFTRLTVDEVSGSTTTVTNSAGGGGSEDLYYKRLE